MLKPPSRRPQGLVLFESLVALIVLALGVIGIAGLQIRTLVDTHAGVRHGQAIRLAEDLGERIRANPRGLAELARFASDWDAPLDGSVDCLARACDSLALARYDKSRWLDNVRQQLPHGDAAVFLVADETDAANRRQLGVLICWRHHENASGAPRATPAAFPSMPHAVDTGTARIHAPARSLCHLQYLQPNARCLPHATGGLDPQRSDCPGA